MRVAADLGDEAAVEADDERVVGEGEDVSLGEHLLDLVAQYQVVLQQALHREQVARLLVTDQIHAPTDAADGPVLFCSLAVLDPRVGHTMDVLSPFIPVLCHSDGLLHGESCPRLDVVHPGRAWSSSPACTWHCSLHYLFLQATPLFPHGVTIVC